MCWCIAMVWFVYIDRCVACLNALRTSCCCCLFQLAFFLPCSSYPLSCVLSSQQAGGEPDGQRSLPRLREEAHVHAQDHRSGPVTELEETTAQLQLLDRQLSQGTAALDAVPSDEGGQSASSHRGGRLRLRGQPNTLFETTRYVFDCSPSSRIVLAPTHSTTLTLCSGLCLLTHSICELLLAFVRSLLLDVV
jgi:hypothetical protein